jgi:hypothetical protein
MSRVFALVGRAHGACSQPRTKGPGRTPDAVRTLLPTKGADEEEQT